MSKQKLLLADDSVTIQKVVNLTFADEGIEVISVGDGDSAMEKVAEISPDLIMADVNMPGLTGYEICERIRQDDKMRQIPVILLVGSFEPFDEEEARRVGADDYLTKPFQSIRQLVNKVTVLLNSRNNDNGNGLEMDAEDPALATVQTTQYTDTGYDDEMIQTNRPSSFAFDETQKFESKETEELIETASFQTQTIADEPKFEETTDETNLTQTSNEENPAMTFAEFEAAGKSDYEIKDEEPLSSELEKSSYETESNSNVSYPINEDEVVLEEIEETSDEIIDNEELSNETEENPPALEESVAYQIKEDEEVLETEEQTVDILDETKNHQLISDETEDNKKFFQETVSDEIGEIENISTEQEIDDRESEKTTEPENDDSGLVQKYQDEEIPLPEFASVLEFDDDDILQLPPLELDFEDEEEITEPNNTAATMTSPAQTAEFVSTTESNTVINSTQISPELIDMIVAKVLERLSEKAIKEVAWEVVPQMTELIVKKIAEEKLK